MLDQLKDSFDFGNNPAIRSVRLDIDGMLLTRSEYPSTGWLIGLLSLFSTSSVEEVDVTIRSYGDGLSPSDRQIDDFAEIAKLFECPGFRCLRYLQFKVLRDDEMKWEVSLREAFSALDRRGLLRFVYYSDPYEDYGHRWLVEQ